MIETDLLVVGWGAAGFAVALAASHAGLNALMVDRRTGQSPAWRHWNRRPFTP